MPPPPSYLDIAATPYSRVITQAEFNGGTFGGVANQVWFRYVTGATVAFGGYTNAGGTFTPKTFIYASDGTTELHHITGAFGWYYVLPAGTYYLKVVRSAGGASNFNFTATNDTAPLNPLLPPGAIVVNDDTEGFPATAWQLDGTFLGVLTDTPAGEIGDALPIGVQLWEDRFGLHAAHESLAVLDASNTYVTSAVTTPAISGFPNIAHDATQFYALNRTSGVIATVSVTGVVTDGVATLPAGVYQALGVNAAGTIAYWAEGYDSPSIHRHDLVNDAPLSDLYTVPDLAGGDTGAIALSAVNENPGEILVLSDGSVVTWYHNVTQDTNVLLHLSPAGAVLHNYTFSGAFQYIDHVHYAPDDPDAIHIWFYQDTGATVGRFGHLVLSLGTLDVSFDRNLFSAGQNLVGSEMFGPSTSCTMLTIVYSGGGATGTIEVVKRTVPAGLPQVFDFFTDGGLLPDTFQLLDGGMESFPDLAPGSGYAVSEVPVAGFQTTYQVSNGSPHDDLTLAAGEVVRVTVTNTALPVPVCPPSRFGLTAAPTGCIMPVGDF